MNIDGLKELWKKEVEQATARKESIIRFLKDNIEPYDDELYGLCYRASAYLTDGTYLPCVIFRNRESRVNYANKVIRNRQINKWFSSKSVKNSNDRIYEGLVVGDNQISFEDINKVEKCKYAFPCSLLKQIGEIALFFVRGFVAKMKDGKYVGFRTDARTEFFDMPDEYSGDDIIEIINDCYVYENGQIKIRKQKELDDNEVFYKDADLYREKPFFICYFDI